MIPTIGRIVHYTIAPARRDGPVETAPVIAPAIVTAVRDDRGVVDLHLFLPDGTRVVQNVWPANNPNGLHRHWHWPNWEV